QRRRARDARRAFGSDGDLAVGRIPRDVVEEILRYPNALDVAEELASEVDDLAHERFEHLASALEVQVAPHGEDALVAVTLHEVHRGSAAEAPVRHADPAVREVEVVRKENAQRLMDAKQ